MKLLRSEAIVLRRIDYGEADRIVTLYARDAGLIKGFAAHARGSSSARFHGPSAVD